MNFECCRCWLQQMCTELWSKPFGCVGVFITHYLESIYLIFFTSICPRLLHEYKICVLVFPQKDKDTSYNYYQEHIRFWCDLAICWRAFNHCVAFRVFGFSGHCGKCKCISSMLNVCCACHHWFSHKFDNDNYLGPCSPAEWTWKSSWVYSPQRPCWSYQKLPEVPVVTLLSLDWAL